MAKELVYAVNVYVIKIIYLANSVTFVLEMKQ